MHYLEERAGRLVTQTELPDAIWPDTFVQPEMLESQIMDVRMALGWGTAPRIPVFRGRADLVQVAEVPPAEHKLVGRVAPMAGLAECLAKAQ